MIQSARAEPGADAKERRHIKHWRIASKAVEWIRPWLLSLVPYLAVGLFLPGGSIMALLLWIYRHRTAARPTVERSSVQNGELCRCSIERSSRSLSTIGRRSHQRLTPVLAEVLEDAAAVYPVQTLNSAGL